MSANGRAALLEPADDSESAWILFQEIVEEIQDELGGDPNFEVRSHPQDMRDLPGRRGRLIYDQVVVTKDCVMAGAGTEARPECAREFVA